MKKIFGIEPRFAIIAVMGVVALAFYLRTRSAASSAVPAPLPAAEPPGMYAASSASDVPAQSGYADQLQAMEIKAQEQEALFRSGQLQRQAALETAGNELQIDQLALQSQVYDKFLGKRKKLPKGTKCASGDLRYDAVSGQLYCRHEQSHGFFGDVAKSLPGGSAGGFVGTLLTQYAGSLLPATSQKGRQPSKEKISV